jgi:antitoxin component YwqK of YwqJK toxin-antitoxin module
VPVGTTLDTDQDGHMDLFQRFENNALVALERDSNRDGRIDLKILYEQGKQKMLTRDRDHDGRFETTQWFDRPPWDYLTEVDLDDSGTIDERSFFKAKVLRRTDLFEKKGLRLISRNHYDENGQLQKSEIFDVKTGQQEISWMFDETGAPVEAAKDQDKNGQVDIWFHYKHQRIASIEEDSNGDGEKDVWETYDEKENLVLRKKDIDFDGVADIEERN